MMYKMIWVAGMPRSGSMWTYNVVRELLKRAGFRVLPEEVQLTDQAWADYAKREIAAHSDPKTVFVLKVHAPLDHVPPNNLVITNIRDVRDALISYMRFMHVDFEMAYAIAQIWVKLVHHYQQLSEEQCMVLRYDDLTAAPKTTVTHIADRLGLPIDEATADTIAAQFSKEKVKTLIESNERLCRESMAAGRSLERGMLLERADGKSATIDWSTGFQSEHVSNYEDGGWRHLLSEDQIGALDSTFGDWLTRNGFAA